MAKSKKSLEGANGQLRPEAPPGLGNALGHAPQLTRYWGRFMAFLAIVNLFALSVAAIKPEIALYAVAIHVTTVSALLIAAHLKLLD